MRIHQLVEVGNGLCPDVLGYFAYGHQDKAAFCKAVDAEFRDDEELEINHDFVEHLLYTIAEHDCGDEYFIFSKEIGEPITVWQ